MAVQERKSPLSERQIEYMMIVFIRVPNAMEMARTQLTPGKFAEHHRGLAALWAVVCDHFAELGELPDEEIVCGELERRLAEDPEGLSDDELALLDAYIRRAYKVPQANLKPNIVRTAFNYLQSYLEQRVADQIRRDLTVSTFVPEDLCTQLSDYQADIQRIKSLTPKGLSKPFPEGWDKTKAAVTKSSTGLTFLDDMLNGGQADKEVYGLLGPHGSCKTTIAIQYSTHQADMLRREWLKNKKQEPLKIVYMFIYESDIDEMRLRALSSLGRIDRNVLEEGVWDSLSTRDNYKSYERKMFKRLFADKKSVLSEQERYRQAERNLNVNWRCVDMTGNDEENPGRGWGLVPEIMNIIMMDQDHHKAQGLDVAVGPIIIDYAGAAVKRHLDHQNMDYSSNLRHFISSFPMQCKNQLAIRFKTPVLALHQLSGRANDLSAAITPKSTDAAEAKNWRENLDFSFIVGNPSDENYVIFHCDKHRRAPIHKETIIAIRGELSCVEHRPHHMVDHRLRRIVLKSEMQTLEDVDDELPPPKRDIVRSRAVAQTNSIRQSSSPPEEPKSEGGRRDPGR